MQQPLTYDSDDELVEVDEETKKKKGSVINNRLLQLGDSCASLSLSLSGT